MKTNLYSIAWRLALVGILAFAIYNWIIIPRSILADGTAVPARVINTWDPSIEVNDAPLVGILLEAQPPGGQSFEFKKYCRDGYGNDWMFERGARVEVKMDARYPGRVVISSNSCDTDNISILTITFGVIGSITVLPMLLGLFLRGLVAVPGEIGPDAIEAQATVLKVERKSWTVEDKQAALMWLQVQPPGDAPYPVKTLQLVHQNQFAWYSPGVQVRVKYDPKHMKRVQLIGPCAMPDVSLEDIQAGAPAESPAGRLEKLEELRSRRLISEDEFQRIRAEILKAL